MNIINLFDNLIKIDYKELYKMESEFYLLLCEEPFEKRLSCVNAYLIISSWFGTSQRSGVWTFYEATNLEEIDATLQYLKTNNDMELAEIFEKGIHDYHNPIYAENFDYPEEWIEESDEIDKWIMEHEEWLWQWEYKMLIDNEKIIKEYLCR